MNKSILSFMMASAVLVSGCESAEQKAERLASEQAALAVCPADQVLADISSFAVELPALDGGADAFHAALGAREGVSTTESGLQYSVVQSGNVAGPQPEPTNIVRVNYHGIFPDGVKFDSSYDRGEPAEFPLNRVIRGWTEGVGLMRPCDAWTFYIPSDLAYGPNGRPGIPGGASLIFHVQLLEVK